LYLWLLIKREHYQAAVSSARGVLNVLDYGAVCDGEADDSHAINEAIDDGFRHNVSVYIPKRICRVVNPIVLRTGTVIRSDGATLLHGGDTGTLMHAISADDWVIDGPLTLVGTRIQQGQTGDESGFVISGANRYIVNQLTVRDFKGTAIEITGGKPSRAARGDRGKFAFISIINNHLGLAITDGRKYSAEYNLFSLMTFSGNDTAIQIVAGNNVISTSNIVDNGNGLLLSKGLNDGHGIVSAVNINHNHGFNVKADHVSNGYSFNGCHIYADTNATGSVAMIESKGIEFSGCVIEPPLQ
jgi:hypothetical protein